ncbi:hypothetical protein [Actinomadura sp. 9N407]|uniref:hypothetical protein n=1 Tax=Actinomadura sp. 9N407 TaxID=3375154 RepID=UPI003798B4F0
MSQGTARAAQPGRSGDPATGRRGAARRSSGRRAPRPARTVTTARGLTATVTVEPARQAPPPPREGTRLCLDEALLPMFVWPNLPVLRAERKRLSIIERFVLEMAAELEDFTTEEFGMLVGLPPQALTAIARSLVAADALQPTATGYRATPLTERTLLQEEVVVHREGRQSFVFLPETGELTAPHEHVAGWIGRMAQARVRPVLNMPLPAAYDGKTRSEYIDERLAEDGTLPRDIVQVLQTEEQQVSIGNVDPVTSAPVCPVYRAENVVVEGTGPAEVTFRLTGAKGADSFEGRLTGADELAEIWWDLAGVLAHPSVTPLVWGALRPSRRQEDPPAGLVLEETPGTRSAWLLRLPGPAARLLATGTKLLYQPRGLKLRGERGTVRVRLALEPADAEAEALFAIDLIAARQNTESPSSLEDEVAAARSDQVTPEAVVRRMWRLHYYRAVYRLREDDDFGYG